MVHKTLKDNEELKERLKREQGDKQRRAKYVKENLKAFLKVPARVYQEILVKKVRVTHCWRCKQYLDSERFFIYKTCGWIICDCGACVWGW